jgi:hypothetical protein
MTSLRMESEHGGSLIVLQGGCFALLIFRRTLPRSRVVSQKSTHVERLADANGLTTVYKAF